MSQASALVARLADAGIDSALLADVAQELFTAEAERNALAARREHERARKVAQRSRDSAGQDGTDADPSFDKKPPQTPSKIKSNQISPYIPQTLEAWNTVASRHGLPQIEKITGKRLKALMARIGEHGLDAVLRAISNVPNSPHWLGANGWLGNLDSLLRPDNFQRMIENTYAGKAQPAIKPKGPLTPDELRSAIRYRRDIGDEAKAQEYENELKQRLAA